MDVVSWLQTCIKNNVTIKESGDVLLSDLGEVKKDAATNIAVGSGGEKYYTILDLYVLWLAPSGSRGAYIKLTKQYSCTAVPAPQVQSTLAYLRGETQTIPNLDSSAPVDKVSGGVATKRGKAAEAAVEQDVVVDGKYIRKHEIVHINRNSVLQSGKHNFGDVLRQIKVLEQRKAKEKSASGSGRSGDTTKYDRWQQRGSTHEDTFGIDLLATSEPVKKVAAVPVKKTPKRVVKTPIIIVPKAGAPVTLRNAKQFLEQGVLASAKQGGAKETRVYVYHTVGDQKYKYTLVDDPAQVGNDWDRVIAVLALGKEWQFKGKWKPSSSPADLFKSYCGISFYQDNPPALLKQWNCTPIRVDPSKPQINSGAMFEFWKVLLTWAQPRFPNLAIA
eukprot:m.24885 g.24885  ORF g.24885 m.24885 type:complete len:389 (+) comp8651_c0_seq1:181-1347(+)